MTTRIAVRLPDELVECVDRSEGAGSRAGGPRAGLVLYRQQQRDEQDADPGGVRDYDDIDELFETHTSIES
jgi:hypothetical protein